MKEEFPGLYRIFRSSDRLQIWGCLASLFVKACTSLLLTLSLILLLTARATADSLPGAQGEGGEPLRERPVIPVGAYDFPPYATVGEDYRVGGAVADLLELLNRHQTRFTFVARSVTPKRRYTDLQNRRYDAVFFEMAEWGWQEYPVLETQELALDEEVFVTSRENLAANPALFESPQTHRIAGILGYHYAFAGFKSDEAYLYSNYLIVLSGSQEKNLELLLLNRKDIAEIALLQRSFLDAYFETHPEARERLAVRDEPDQIYRLRALLHPQSPLSPVQLNLWLTELENSGDLEQLRRRHGLRSPH